MKNIYLVLKNIKNAEINVRSEHLFKTYKVFLLKNGTIFREHGL